MNARLRRSRSVVYGVTIGKSAFGLLRGQLRWLREQGWDVSLATTPDDSASEAANREGVALHGIPMQREISPLADLGALLRWIRLLHRLRPAAVNVSTPKAGLLGGIAAWVTGVPKRVYVVRGLRLEGARGLMSKVLWAVEWITMQAATDLIFVSPSLARECQKRGLLDPSKSWTIGAGSSNGVDWEAVYRRSRSVDSAAIRNSLELVEDDFVVGFIGRITKDKGVDTLVRAFKDAELNPAARLVAIGPLSDEESERGLKELHGRARWVPPTTDVWGYLGAIDVLCLPTIREGFPNVVLEAAAAEVPTITTTATGSIDSVVDGVTGYLIEVGNPEALVDRLNRMAADKDMVSRMGKAARRRVAAEFQPERIWRGILEILESAQVHSSSSRVRIDLDMQPKGAK